MIAAALEEWDETWKDDAVATIIALSLAHDQFTCDDLRREIRQPPRSSQYGAAFRSAQAQGLIESISSVKSSTSTRNNGRHLQWRRKTQGVTK